jgi:mannose-6-phosphate isomerase-like protein (cupin superfamily)
MSWRNDSAALLEQHRRPIAQDKVQSEDMITDAEDGGPRVCGTRRELCHPDWCYTSTMTVTILTLYSGSELVSQSTTRTEFYYVIKGEGLYVKGDAAANPSELSLTLSPGDCFVVDPFCTRGFKATGRGDLVLLRTTDGINAANEQNTVRELSDPIAAASDMLTVGLQKVEALVASYYNTPKQIALEETKGDKL